MSLRASTSTRFDFSRPPSKMGMEMDGPTVMYCSELPRNTLLGSSALKDGSPMMVTVGKNSASATPI